MWNRLSLLLPLLLLMLSPLVSRSAEEDRHREFPAEFTAAMDYLLKREYPEVFGDKSYKIQPRAYEIVDIDGDGTTEVFIAFKPHYRQSPTIIIFNIDRKGKIKRLTEGIAPGPLVPVNGEYLDSHTLGMGVDFRIRTDKGKAPDKKRRQAMVKATLKQKGRIVAYRNFFHMDKPKGSGTYLDMTHLPRFDDSGSDEAFQFAEIDGIAGGYLDGNDKRRFFVAAAGEQLYIYRIDGFDGQGLLKKRLWVINPKPGVTDLVAQKGRIAYKDRKGAVHSIKAPR